MARTYFGLSIALFAALLTGCAGPRSGNSAAALRSVDLNNPAIPVAQDQPVTLSAARNEWVSFTLEIGPLPQRRDYAVRLAAPKNASGGNILSSEIFEANQIISMPVDTNRAGYVRHTGLQVSQRRLPRALLPMKLDRGRVNLNQLRSQAENAQRAGALIWIDVHIPPEAPAGEYNASCDLIARGGKKIASLPLKLVVYDFALPQERHLQVASRLSWEALVRLYPGDFETVTPRLINRGDDRYVGAVRTLDQLIALAQQHRTSLFVPRLQPTVKWPADQPPIVDWSDYDSLVAPWMSGTAFSDRIPVDFWPLPAPDYLDRFDWTSQSQYWSQAAAHCDQNEWLERSPVWTEPPKPARNSGGVELSKKAAQLLAIHPRLCALVPMADDEIALAAAQDEQLITSASAQRLICASPGLVFAQPPQRWPADIDRPQHWLRTDLPGLVPYVGAGGDEHDVRLWAWLAFLRQAKLIVWNDALPSLSDPATPADPNELIWFYPGEWFGLDHPVPTVQLKWLRRAQQDYEYLWLAKERGEVLNALLIARLMTKPVEIQPSQPPDPAYALMCGTTSAQAWTDVLRLLAQSILLRSSDQPVDPEKQHALYIETLRWLEPQERPILMGRGAQWQAGTGNWINLKLGIDIYNASETTPDANLLQWTAVPQGWEIQPQPMSIPSLATYHVLRSNLPARFNMDELSPASRSPLEVTFTNGFTNRTSVLKLILPVVTSERREGHLAFNGKLDDWNSADLIQSGRLVRMLNRPALQAQELQFAGTDSQIFTGWAAENFYIGFGLDGASTAQSMSRNFVDYQFRRAWGEDLCEILIQPVYSDGKQGAVLHLVCKPNGSVWIERKLDRGGGGDPWQPLEGASVRYVSSLQGQHWTGELSIPWAAILQRDAEKPPLLRFNFVQHKTSNGESASWAGPIDFGRDDALMGVLQIKDADTPGMGTPGDLTVSGDSSQ